MLTSIQTQASPIETPIHLLVRSRDHLLLYSSGAFGLLEPEENGNDGQKQPAFPMKPDIPLNFDDLTDEQLEKLIRSFIAQAATLYRSGIYQEGGAQ